MFQDLFVPGQTEYNQETLYLIVDTILDRKIEVLQCTLALIDWRLKVGSLPECITDDPKTAIAWYHHEGKVWHEARTTDNRSVFMPIEAKAMLASPEAEILCQLRDGHMMQARSIKVTRNKRRLLQYLLYRERIQRSDMLNLDGSPAQPAYHITNAGIEWLQQWELTKN